MAVFGWRLMKVLVYRNITFIGTHRKSNKQVVFSIFIRHHEKASAPFRVAEASNPLKSITNTLNEEDLSMMIDFSKIVELVPDGGRLILTFTTRANKKQNGDEGTKEVSVVFAQQFKGKENDNDFSPIIITGDIAELTDSFESTIADIARDQERLAELKTTTTGRVDQKKRQLSDAIQKHTKAADKSDPKKEGEQKEEKRAEAKEEKPKPAAADLFSMSPSPPAASETGAAVAATESETFGPDATEGVDHG